MSCQSKASQIRNATPASWIRNYTSSDKKTTTWDVTIQAAKLFYLAQRLLSKNKPRLEADPAPRKHFTICKGTTYPKHTYNVAQTVEKCLQHSRLFTRKHNTAPYPGSVRFGKISEPYFSHKDEGISIGTPITKLRSSEQFWLLAVSSDERSTHVFGSGLGCSQTTTGK